MIYYALYSFPSLLGHLLGTVGKALATAGVGVDPGQWLEEAVAENEERIEELEDVLRNAERSGSETCGEGEFFC